jgi:hypothetical protein
MSKYTPKLAEVHYIVILTIFSKYLVSESSSIFLAMKSSMNEFLSVSKSSHLLYKDELAISKSKLFTSFIFNLISDENLNYS